MPAKINLNEAIEEIITAVVNKLQAATVEGQPLEEVESVVRGDRARPRPPVPSLWVFAETAQPQHSPRTIAETWHLPIVITPVVKESEEPEDGYKKATELAAKARSIVIKDRSLGLRAYVQDVRSGRFEPSAPWHRRETLYSAVAVILVIFTICEDFNS